ncbi:TadE/TadG family type IV pilus assembly protein [Bosea sp. (in: a-proteobacteria)]|uniref:TadE/TadG family type IV pilus assembly protein n=1 Tax=Bosea sp. (in: a-proteobacteria) TaxID=1871050 RepID=UPI0026151E4C|nr:TadE/TadG family type IV pilus assembly protein [Bosea sp. (in: a-proteobacteria)]MCO5090258.1 pilus assembly protein [Bosea sp. (in: a-proteobacteria)]
MTHMRKKTGLRSLRRFRRDQDGVAMVEFAMAFPIMLVAYCGLVDVAQMVMLNRKVTQLASTLSDLTARVQSVTPSDIDNIFNASQTVLMPFGTSNASMVIANVVVDAGGTARVCWSNQRNATAPARGSTVTLPDSARIPGTSVIMARASYKYTPAIGYVITGTFTLGDNPVYSRPRNGLATGVENIEQVVRTGTNGCPNFS